MLHASLVELPQSRGDGPTIQQSIDFHNTLLDDFFI